MHINDIKQAYAKGQAVPPKQLANAILTDQELFFSYLIDNNPAIINKVLRQDLQHDFLPMVPDRTKIGASINALILKKDIKALNKIAEKFELNHQAKNYTTRPELVTEIKKLIQNV